MARLQILELPEGSNDDRPPFILVVDQCIPQRIALGADASYGDYWHDLADKIGARGVIVTPETVDIPANDLTTPVDEAFKSEVQDWAAGTNETLARIIDALSGPTKRTSATEGLRLAKRRDELANALGMEQGSNWDDIRNTAAEFRSELIRSENARERLRQERDKQAGELDQLRAGEEPGYDPAVVPTPGQWIARWNQSTPKDRLSMAAQILAAMPRANNCLMADHEAQIAHLRREIDQLRGTSANPDA
ncbi:hypothetical protein ACFW2I_08900 [Streptomyces nigra]|uniref:hypothetical protein n=1 Tax=Streptomyces nigra TaxID=1827580 RepID=UPI0036A35099